MLNRTRHTRLAIFASLCLYLLFGAASVEVRAQTAPSPLPAPTGYVNDYAGVIDQTTKAQLETILTNLKERADIEFVVATVRTTGDQPIFDYTLAVARGWGIGASEGEKNGLLLLVAVDDRKYQIQVSRHLEGDLPDGLVGELGRRMRGSFRAGNYSEGIALAVQTFVATLAEKRGFSIEGIDQSYAYRAERAQPRSRSGGRRESRSSFSVCGIIFVIAIIFFLFSRRGSSGGGSGCLNALLLGSLFNSLGSGGSSGGWGGSSSGWGGGDGGGGGGFGGFGGGGDFGGGGAGGDW